MTITQKFRSLGWVAAVALAALACYLISYRVSAERIALEDVEANIEQAQGDILALSTEFETRSRMSQLERWNRQDFVLTAPTAEQVLDGEIELAALFDAPERLAVQHAVARPDAGSDTDTGGDDDSFDPPAADDLPRIQQAAYLVPGAEQQLARGQRIAFLDDRLRNEIAVRANREQGTEDAPR